MVAPKLHEKEINKMTAFDMFYVITHQGFGFNFCIHRYLSSIVFSYFDILH